MKEYTTSKDMQSVLNKPDQDLVRKDLHEINYNIASILHYDYITTTHLQCALECARYKIENCIKIINQHIEKE